MQIAKRKPFGKCRRVFALTAEKFLLKLVTNSELIY